MNARESEISTGSVRSGIGSRTSMNGYRPGWEDAEAVVAAHIHAAGLHQGEVVRIEPDPARRERLANRSVREHHRRCDHPSACEARERHGTGRAPRCAPSSVRPRCLLGGRTAIARWHVHGNSTTRASPARCMGDWWRGRTASTSRGCPTTGGAPWRAGAPPPPKRTRRAPVRGRRRGLARESSRCTSSPGGMMGQTPGRPACRNPFTANGCPAGRRPDRPSQSRPDFVDHAPGTDAGGSVRQPAATAASSGSTDLRRRAARRLHAVRAQLRHRRPARPQRVRGRARLRRPRRPAPADLGRGLDDLRVALLDGYFVDDVARLARAGRGGRPRVRRAPLSWAGRRAENRTMGALYTAEPASYVLGDRSGPGGGGLRPDDARGRRAGARLNGARLSRTRRPQAWPRRGSVAPCGSRRRHPALPVLRDRSGADRP